MTSASENAGSCPLDGVQEGREKRGWDMGKLRAVILLLIENAPLDPRFRDHSLRERWAGYRPAAASSE